MIVGIDKTQRRYKRYKTVTIITTVVTVRPCKKAPVTLTVRFIAVSDWDLKCYTSAFHPTPFKAASPYSQCARKAGVSLRHLFFT